MSASKYPPLEKLRGFSLIICSADNGFPHVSVASEHEYIRHIHRARKKMPPRKSLIPALIAIGLLIGPVAIFEISGALKYVYQSTPAEDSFAAFGLFLLFVTIAPVSYLIFTMVRLAQRRWLEAFALLFVPVLVVTGLVKLDDWNYRAALRFKINKPEYMAAVAADPPPPPKYRVLDWGNYGGGFGSAITFEAIVYDESGEIALDPASRSQEWRARRSMPWPEARWITEPPGPYARPCSRSVNDFGEHFYFIKETC